MLIIKSRYDEKYFSRISSNSLTSATEFHWNLEIIHFLIYCSSFSFYRSISLSLSLHHRYIYPLSFYLSTIIILHYHRSITPSPSSLHLYLSPLSVHLSAIVPSIHHCSFHIPISSSSFYISTISPPSFHLSSTICLSYKCLRDMTRYWYFFMKTI